MRRPYDNSGKELDALYSVERISDGFDLIIESRGGPTGGRPRRNPDYEMALELHLNRMRDRGMVLLEVQVASRPAMQKPEVERRVELDDFTLPLELATIGNLSELRKSIARASAAYMSTGRGGNPTKRMRLRMSWPDAAEMNSEQIEELLQQAPIRVLPEEPTGDPDELARRVTKVLNQFRTANGRNRVPVPKGQKFVSRTSQNALGFVRDPNVVAWILHTASGRCEACNSPAPFDRENGEPFLEVHHVRPLGEGGPDTVDNAIACCPNCHRRLHYGCDRSHLRREIIGSIERLVDYPERTLE